MVYIECKDENSTLLSYQRLNGKKINVAGDFSVVSHGKPVVYIRM